MQNFKIALAVTVIPVIVVTNQRHTIVSYGCRNVAGYASALVRTVYCCLSAGGIGAVGYF